MKQKKSLELQKGISLVAEIDSANETQLYIQVGKKFIHLDLTSILQLRDWLSKEVLNGGSLLPMINIPSCTIPQTIITSKGPLIAQPGDNMSAIPIEDRRAVVTSGGAVDLSKTEGLITPKDELRVQNLSGSIGKAKEAFSPAHINDGGKTE